MRSCDVDTCNAAKSVVSQVATDHKEYVPLYSCLGEDGLSITGMKYWGVDENGNTVWYADYSEAAEAVAAQGGIVKLYANAELNLTQDTFVDLKSLQAKIRELSPDTYLT